MITKVRVAVAVLGATMLASCSGVAETHESADQRTTNSAMGGRHFFDIVPGHRDTRTPRSRVPLLGSSGDE
jgi:hypothetical protein